MCSSVLRMCTSRSAVLIKGRCKALHTSLLIHNDGGSESRDAAAAGGAAAAAGAALTSSGWYSYLLIHQDTLLEYGRLVHRLVAALSRQHSQRQEPVVLKCPNLINQRTHEFQINYSKIK